MKNQITWYRLRNICISGWNWPRSLKCTRQSRNLEVDGHFFRAFCSDLEICTGPILQPLAFLQIHLALWRRSFRLHCCRSGTTQIYWRECQFWIWFCRFWITKKVFWRQSVGRGTLGFWKSSQLEICEGHFRRICPSVLCFDLSRKCGKVDDWLWLSSSPRQIPRFQDFLSFSWNLTSR